MLYNFIVSDDPSESIATYVGKLSSTPHLFPNVHLQLLLPVALAHHNYLEDRVGW